MNDENPIGPYSDMPPIDIPDDIGAVYRIALADFRLRRGHLLPPCLAAVVDAVFLVVDPLGRSTVFHERDAGEVYDDVAGRVWLRLTAALMLAVDDAECDDMMCDGSTDEDGAGHVDGRVLDEPDALMVGPGLPEIPFAVVRGIVADELVAAVTRDLVRDDISPGADGGGPSPVDDEEFLEIVGREFGASSEVSSEVFELVETVAAMIHLRLVRGGLFR